MSDMIKMTSATDMVALHQVCEMLVRSSFCGVRKSEDALWIVATGHSLGIDPVTSLRGIHVISGKPVLSADLMSAVAMRHPECEYLRVVEMTPERATVHVKRRGWPEHTVVTFGIEDAKAADLLKNPTWKKYPSDMCKARAIARAARAAFPDALLGVYVEGELDEAPEPQRATVEALDVTPSAAPPVTHPVKLTAGEEHDALCNQLRRWCVEANIKGKEAGEVAAGFVVRYGGDGAKDLGTVPLAELRVGIEDLRIRILRHTLPVALRDTAEYVRISEVAK